MCGYCVLSGLRGRLVHHRRRFCHRRRVYFKTLSQSDSPVKCGDMGEGVRVDEWRLETVHVRVPGLYLKGIYFTKLTLFYILTCQKFHKNFLNLFIHSHILAACISVYFIAREVFICILTHPNFSEIYCIFLHELLPKATKLSPLHTEAYSNPIHTREFLILRTVVETSFSRMKFEF